MTHTTICPKCQYQRQPADTAPDYECPACGIVYHKYLDHLAQQAERLRVAEQAAEKQRARHAQIAHARTLATAQRKRPTRRTSLTSWIALAIVVFGIAAVIIQDPTPAPPSTSSPRTIAKPDATRQQVTTPPLTPEEQVSKLIQEQRTRAAIDNIDVCRRRILQAATYPESVDFKLFGASTERWLSDERHLVQREFTTKNAYGMESRHIATCLFDEQRNLIQFKLSEPPPR